MEPQATGRSYDTIAKSWQERTPQSYGLAQHERALRFASRPGLALDIGCGSQGRIMDLLLRQGFRPEGIDVSSQMIALARGRHPDLTFHEADISQWNFPKKYDFISAWDSVWHLPLALQEPVLKKICEGLNPGGVYIFTTAGFDEPADKSAESVFGFNLDYGILGIPRSLELLSEYGCICRHLEYDQYPEMHLYIIAQKRDA
jgi:2-polyprenyl-3-methyl-5-hydroxy-6-metoxy-1,4-benzoquinol methylase